jgi:hypothetical protein
MTLADRRRPGWSFYLGWVALGLISLLIALGLYRVLIPRITAAVGDTVHVGGVRHITEDFLLPYIIWPAQGLTIGLLQYVLLRRYLPRMGWWIVATALAWPPAYTVIYRMAYATYFSNAGAGSAGFVALAIVVVSGLFGAVQWLVLRRRVRHAAWWIPATLVGWGTVGLVASGPASDFLALALGIVPPTVSAVTLWLLLDRLPRRAGAVAATSP